MTQNPNYIRLQKAKFSISRYFEDLDQRIFTQKDISDILNANRKKWNLTKSTGRDFFINFLIEETPLKEIRLEFPYSNVLKYAWGEIDIYELANEIKQESYFSHFSAMYLHQITEQIPKSIYINIEQSPKHYYPSELTQERIDIAFKNKPRTTSNTATYMDYKLYLLSGKFTNKIGVINLPIDDNLSFPVTNLERTLIDIVVRPIYSGGVSEVLNAYRLANTNEEVSTNVLASYLRDLDYTYPYHQCIGFYMEKSGVYSNTAIELLERFERKFDFYLAHNMHNPSYDKKWRLYYPKGL